RHPGRDGLSRPHGRRSRHPALGRAAQSLRRSAELRADRDAAPPAGIVRFRGRGGRGLPRRHRAHHQWHCRGSEEHRVREAGLPCASDIRRILVLAPVIPVLTVAKLEHAGPLARALVAGGLSALEVTLRTPCALGAIAAMRAAVPDAVVGAGTLTRPGEFKEAEAAGAQFGVSPGFAPELAAAATL